MKPKILDMDIHWQRVIDEQLSFMLEIKDESSGMNPYIFVGGGDARESTLKALVQQAARN